MASTTVADLVAQLQVVDVVLPEGPPPPRWNVAPTSRIVAVAEDAEGRRRLGLLEWGLQGRHFNARAETLLVKPTFRDAYRRRRCLIPADGFYEWKDGRPVFARGVDAGPIWFAGLWGDGACAVVTTAANDDLAPYHHRMPVVLGADDWPAWLARSETDTDALAPLLAGAPVGSLLVYPVRPLVNDARRDGPELIEPTAPGEDVSQPSLLD